MVKLKWVEMIRESLKKGVSLEVSEFIRPILEFGEAEEKRIDRDFKLNEYKNNGK
jgi:hypothetical protein